MSRACHERQTFEGRWLPVTLPRMQATPGVYLGRTHFINGRISNITVRWAAQELESSLVLARVCLTGALESGGDATGQVCVDVIEAPAAIAEAIVTLDAAAIGLELEDIVTTWAWIQVSLALLHFTSHYGGPACCQRYAACSQLHLTMYRICRDCRCFSGRPRSS